MVISFGVIFAKLFLTQYILQIMVYVVVLVCNEVHRNVPNFVVLHPRKQ